MSYRHFAAVFAVFGILLLSSQPFASLAQVSQPEENISTEAGVIISEFYPDSPHDDQDADETTEGYPEFIEIHNRSGADIPLSSLEIIRNDDLVDLESLAEKNKMPLNELALTDGEMGNGELVEDSLAEDALVGGVLASAHYLAFKPSFPLVNNPSNLQLYFVSETAPQFKMLLQTVTYDGGMLSEDASIQLFNEEWYTTLAPTPGLASQHPPEGSDGGGENDDGSDDGQNPETGSGEENNGTDGSSGQEEKPECAVTNKVVRISEIVSSPSDDEFIELRNYGNKKVSLAGCTLSTDKNYEQQLKAGVSIPAKGYKVFELSNNLLNGGGTVVFSGKTYEHKIVYPELGQNEAYARIGDEWKVTAKPTPGKPNRLPTAAERLAALNERLGTCPPGESRSLETSRCSRNQAEDSGLKPCDPNQFRNPETNRCKSKSSTSNSLKPCAPDQFRNPDTNRCKKKDSGNDLKPCDEDQYRNPETNRCRKKESIGGGVLGTDSGDSNKAAGAQNIAVLLIAGAFLLLFLAYEYRLAIRRWIAKLKPPKAPASS